MKIKEHVSAVYPGDMIDSDDRKVTLREGTEETTYDSFILIGIDDAHLTVHVRATMFEAIKSIKALLNSVQQTLLDAPLEVQINALKYMAALENEEQ